MTLITMDELLATDIRETLPGTRKKIDVGDL